MQKNIKRIFISLDGSHDSGVLRIKNANEIIKEIPSNNGDVIQRVAVAISSTKIHWNPSLDELEVTV